MKVRWPAWVALAVSAAALACLLGWENGLRESVRRAYFAHLRGTPLIKEVPRTPVDCRTLAGPRTMVALVFGQSNAANFGRGRFTPKAAVYELQGSRCFVAADPLIGADGDGASVWTRLGDRLVRDGTYERVVFVGVAVGGSEIARWSQGGDLHNRVLAALGDAKASGLEATHLLWHQGEQDAHLRTSEAEYTRSFEAMTRSIRGAGSAAPLFVSLASYCYGVTSDDVRRGQASVVSPRNGILPGPDTDVFRGRDDRYDDCHLSTAGLQKVAEAWAQILADHAAAAGSKQ
jgi:hypothetical protein